MLKDDELARRLAFVAPERRALVERRLAILINYVALERPTTEHARAAASEMGLTTAGFYRIVSIWRNTRDPVALEGTTGPAPGPQPSRFDDEAFIRSVLNDLPPGQMIEHDVDDVLLEAERTGIKIRGRSTLRRFVKEFRAERDAVRPSVGGLLLDHAALAIPVDSNDGDPTMPIATILVDVARRSILTVRLAVDPPTAETMLAALRDAVRRDLLVADPSAPRDLTYVRGAGDDWEVAERHLREAGVRPRGSRSKAIKGGLSGKLIEPSLLGVKTLPAMVSLEPHERRAKLKKGDQILSLETAQLRMDERLDVSGRGGPTPFSRQPAVLRTLGS